MKAFWNSIELYSFPRVAERLAGLFKELASNLQIRRMLVIQKDIQTIINKSEAVKKAKKEGEEKLTPKEKKELMAVNSVT